jgi:60 kDa SS-A/Ro ribonucleoprotein
MASLNKKAEMETDITHGGAVVRKLTPAQELQRTVLSCLLWEDTFYESGESAATRIKKLVPLVDPKAVAALAIQARTEMKLRHVPLLLVSEMCRYAEHRKAVRETLSRVIQRADELAEFLAIYWDGKTRSKRKLAKAAFKGLEDAFPKFSEYDFAKYKGDDKEIKLSDVIRLVRPKPINTDQAALWGRVRRNQLKTPDTWEVGISAAKDKKAEWTRLLTEGKLGALALIRNLRNMTEAEVESSLIRQALRDMKTERVLPFRFVAAMKHAPKFTSELDAAMLRCLQGLPKLTGHTIIVVDVSGSMGSLISSKSELNRLDSAATLAAMARELCESVEVYATAGNDYSQVHRTQMVKAFHGLALVEDIKDAHLTLGRGGIFLKQCIDHIWTDQKQKTATRVLVITDGQDTDRSNKGVANVRTIANHQYVINIAPYKNGIGYGSWTEIDGWSEHVLTYIQQIEGANLQ